MFFKFYFKLLTSSLNNYNNFKNLIELLSTYFMQDKLTQPYSVYSDDFCKLRIKLNAHISNYG